MNENINAGTMLLLLASIIAVLTTVSALECHSCNSLGIGGSHSNDDCRDGDESKLDKTPCKPGSGEVAKCQRFIGSVTIDPHIVDPQTAEGTYRGCVIFKSNAVPQDECFAATDIPNDALSTVFSALYYIGASQSVKGETCYCSGNNCNGANATTRISYVNLALVISLCITFIWNL